MAIGDETKIYNKPKVVEQHIESSETDENGSIESEDDMECGDDMESESETDSLIKGQKDEDRDEVISRRLTESTKSKKQTNSNNSIKSKMNELNGKIGDDFVEGNDEGSENSSDDGSGNSSDENSDISDIADTFDSGGEGDAESDEDNESSGTGLGAVMSSILKSEKKRVILSKAKKDYEIQQKERESDDEDFEVVEEGGTVKKIKKTIKKKEPITRIETEKESMLRRKERENMNRVWPDVQADREKERKLRILATQGVVQLLGAIEKHAKSVDKKLSEARGELQRDKVLETTGKEAFMKVLHQEGKKLHKSNTHTSEIKLEMKEEPEERIPLPAAKKPKWGVLADNFYKEPTLDGWDKESDEE